MQDLTDSPLAAVCCGKLRGMFYGVWAVGTGLAGLNGFAARCSLRGKLREMFYGVWAVEIVLAGLNGFAARCGLLWQTAGNVLWVAGGKNSSCRLNRFSVRCGLLWQAAGKSFGGGVLLGRVVRTGSGVGNISLRAGRGVRSVRDKGGVPLQLAQRILCI